jgi:hypothetical protein
MSIIQIEPLVVPQPDIVYTRLRYEIFYVEPNVSCKVLAYLYTNENVYKTFDLILEQPEYGNWGVDDSFILDWLVAKLGVVIKSPSNI